MKQQQIIEDDKFKPFKKNPIIADASKKIVKYSPVQQVVPVNRTWPSKTITKAPIWASVDLRDGNQALQNPMDIERKLKLYKLLVQMGFKEIEVGYPASSKIEADFINYLVTHHLVAKDVTLQVLTGFRQDMIEKTFEAVKNLDKVIVHLYNSTSKAQREQVFDMSREQVIAMAVKGAKYAKKLSEQHQGQVIWQYSPESYTQTEPDFVIEICEAVMDVLQPTAKNPMIINLPATVEVSMPNVYADGVEYFSTTVKNRSSIILSVHTHNDRGTGVAATEMALLAGAERVEGTLFGNGERTGNTDLINMALNLTTQGIDSNLIIEDINHISDVYKSVTEMPIHPRHPYVGDLVYTAFSGTHQDAISKGMINYENNHENQQNQSWNVPYLPMDPKDIGRSYKSIIRVNSQSGKGGSAYVLKENSSYDLPYSFKKEFGNLIKDASSERSSEVSAQEIISLFEKNYVFNEGAFRLAVEGDEMSVFCNQRKIESVKLKALDNLDVINAFVEAVNKTDSVENVKVIESVVNINAKNITDPKSVKVVCYVQIEQANQHYFGCSEEAISVVASAKAFINAINNVGV